MYYLRARYLSPGYGRFWTMDSYEGNNQDPISLHKYLYAHCDPVDLVDPSGHETLGSILTGASIGAILNVADTCIATRGKAKARDLVASFLLGGTVGAIGGGIAPLFWEAGFAGKVFVGGIGLSMGAWGVGDAIQQENAGLAVYRGATLGISILALAKALPSSQSTTAIANIGEARVAKMLRDTGYRDVWAMKNASGNGLDLIGITPDGRLAVFEVKTSTSGNIGNLTPAQQNMDEYLLGVLGEASEGRLRGQNISPSDTALARRLLNIYRSDPSQVSGTVVGVDLKSNEIYVQPWPGRPGGH
jgi:hypothetical protein